MSDPTVTPDDEDGAVVRLMDLLDEWHDMRERGAPDVALYEFLDMSEDEYVRWLADGVLPVGYKGRLL